MGSQPVPREYAAMWKANLKVIITEWDRLLISARRLWQSTIFRGVPGAEAHVPSDGTQVLSAPVPNPDFGVNDEFIRNYQRVLSLADTNTETFPNSPSLSMLIIKIILYHTDQSYGYRYSSGIPAVLGFPQLFSYILVEAGDQPASHSASSRVGCLPAKSRSSICDKCCVGATCVLGHCSVSPANA